MISQGSDAPEQVRADVCLVGSGPAGMTVALELERLGVSCVLLESGVREPSADYADLNATEQIGIKTDPNGVNRVRALGGTSALWGGLCRPLDDMDFAARSWVPHSGWPLSLAELQPFYRRAHEVLDLPAPHYDLQALPSVRDGALRDRDFQNVVFYYDNSPIRFAAHYAKRLESSQLIRTILDATVVDIQTAGAGNQVQAVTVSTLAGRRFTVVADRFVLAAGAIQTARLLLNGNTAHPAGLGNANDLVGRYFMQHPVLYRPRLLVFDPKARHRLRRDGKDKLAIRTAVKPDTARKHRLLNFHFHPLTPQSPGKREEWLGRMPASLRWMIRGSELSKVGDVGEAPQFLSELQNSFSPGDEPQSRYIPLEIRPEQAPNPDSRILLTEDRDALGVRRAVMDWRLDELDHASIRAGMRLLGGSLARSGVGRLQAGPEQLEFPQPGGAFLHGGNHHYGTARMSESPRSGVVDRNCRVHGLDNLYIAGSAVFPTTGHANPTLTIVALASRLAAHLAANRAN